ncbi:aminopeptidase N-like [Euwallacea similis]|uniref:aminopeptidase N-like n=1 Tax=Euwallacea similis TaxID=1736056 RepID=UPI00345088EE
MVKKFHLLIIFVLGGIEISVQDEESPYRLPKNIVPTNYDLNLYFPAFDLEITRHTFSGSVTMSLSVVRNTTSLSFHASSEYISILQIKIDGTLVKNEDYAVNSLTDILTIENLALEENQTLKVTIDYDGTISTTDNYGIYLSSYTKSNGSTSSLLATQFQATYARRAFPCFDEPSFKATFDVSITYYSDAFLNVHVLFNTKEKNRTSTNLPFMYDAKNTVVKFKTTPMMSTYLLAFIISDFTFTTSNESSDYKVWSRDDLASKRAYAVDIGPKLLEALNGYTGMEYSSQISKLDQVALPDFTTEAMENWGLITYRERSLLWDPENTDDKFKQTIVTAMAHQMAHQWFGNLITCEWWSETFINEGFATYFQYFIPHQVKPTWQLDTQFIVNIVQPSLEVDSMENSQPLKFEANTPQEISSKFGAISYYKGGSLLRMLEQVMGKTIFKQAIQEYIHTSSLQHSTVNSVQLLQFLGSKINQQISYLPYKQTLSDVMQNWIELPGYPLLNVRLDGQELIITQERFLLSGKDLSSKWYVPISYVESKSETKFQIALTSGWLVPALNELKLTMEYNNTWVLVNTFQTGYYRVNYESSLWKGLSDALAKSNFDGIIESNRAQIVDDSFNIAKINKLSYTEVFEIVDFLKNDVSYFPWVPAFNGFQYLLLRTPSGNLKTKLQEHILELMTRLYKSAPINQIKEDHIQILTQALASSWACYLGDSSCVNDVTTIFASIHSLGTKPHKNIRNIVYCNGIRHSINSEDFNYLWQLYDDTEDSNERAIILKALGCSRNVEDLEKILLDTLKNDSMIRSQDVAATFTAVYSGSDQGVEVALEFLVKNFKGIMKKYSSISTRTTVIIGIASRLNTEEQIEKFKSLISTSSEFQTDMKKLGHEALELTQSNLDWIKAHQKDLEEYFGINDENYDNNPENTGAAPKIASTIFSTLLTVIVIIII